MAVKEYTHEGKKCFYAYVSLRSSKDRRIRIQMKRKIDTQGAVITDIKKAQRIEKVLYKQATQLLLERETQGLRWKDVVEQWEYFHKRYPSSKYCSNTIKDSVALMKNWTKPWMNRLASSLSRRDGREILHYAEKQGKNRSFLKRIKSTVNVIFKWGILEGVIPEAKVTPVEGLEIEVKASNEKVPEILSKDEIRKLLLEARLRKHPWFPVWTLAVLTGARNGELFALRHGDCELIEEEQAKDQDKAPAHSRKYGIIRIQRAWDSRNKVMGPTKARYWRNTPVSGELYWFLRDLMKNDFGSDEFGEYLLPRLPNWKNGDQSLILREFCCQIGIRSVRFHALRACFATHLLEQGIPSVTVMKIGGWRDIKTMQIYVRLAGIEEQGATEGLKFIPTEQGIMENVVSMVGFRSSQEK